MGHVAREQVMGNRFLSPLYARVGWGGGGICVEKVEGEPHGVRRELARSEGRWGTRGNTWAPSGLVTVTIQRGLGLQSSRGEWGEGGAQPAEPEGADKVPGTP